MKNNIKVERAILSLTQDDLAKKIGVSRQTINSIEANRYVPSTVLALKLSTVFEKPVNDFYQIDGPFLYLFCLEVIRQLWRYRGRHKQTLLRFLELVLQSLQVCVEGQPHQPPQKGGFLVAFLYILKLYQCLR